EQPLAALESRRRVPHLPLAPEEGVGPVGECVRWLRRAPRGDRPTLAAHRDEHGLRARFWFQLPTKTAHEVIDGPRLDPRAVSPDGVENLVRADRVPAPLEQVAEQLALELGESMESARPQ